jgi:hypothetical protein
MRHAPDDAQGSLFAPAQPEPVRHAMDPHIPMANHAYERQHARPTSAAAAVEALPRSGSQRDKVWQVIRAAGPAGLTDQDIARDLGMAENSTRPRRLELSNPPRPNMPRLVVDSGRTKETSTGSHATVWVAIEHAEVARGA